MGKRDISRSMFDPRKHYTALWQQQGRIVTDFDHNDGQAISAEERRRTRVDVIGGYGSPDDGFRVSSPRRAGSNLDFDLLAGTVYLGGLRLELDTDQTYRTQTDRLQVPNVAAPPAGSARRDLVMLEAFEAAVTAVEDGELLDPALGGADTAARSRRFQRVHVLSNVNAVNCDQAWKLMSDIMAASNTGTLAADCKRLVNTRLTVTYTEEGVDDDLCEPAVGGGYLGAENQAIRVQQVSASTLTWGYDNASPLYRVSLSADRTRVTLITPPRDEYSTPIVGQVIEILPWSARLPNGEKTAALSGHLTRITAVDPNDETAGGAITLTLQTPVPTAGFEDWKNRPDKALMETEGIWYFMNIWNRGSDLASPPAIPFTAGTPVTLGTTGIQVTITGSDRVQEDYWVIAARPETPTRSLPWTLETGAAPDGVTRYFAPLALIHWRADGSIGVSDCRPPFRPLTAVNDCCTFTVGDGKISDGDFNDLGVALERLGANGGDICLLPGTHRATVSLIGRDNITISGCGTRSVLLPADGRANATITLVNCSGIHLVNLAVVNVTGTGILAQRVDGLTIQDVHVLAGVVGIDIDDIRSGSVRRCNVRLLDREGGDVGIYAQGERMTIENSDVQVIPAGELPEPPEDNDPDTPPVNPTDPCADPEDFYLNTIYLVYYVGLIWGLYTLDLPPKALFRTLGGIQIGSGSEIVVVRENLVVGGAGNGITLGSDIADIDFTPPDIPGFEPPEPYVIAHDPSVIRGQLFFEDQPIGGMTIFFEDDSGAIFSFPVASDGTFAGRLPGNKYAVTVSDEDFRVVKHEPLGDAAYFFFLERNPNPRPRPTGGDDLLAFIHDVLIQENTIANMSLSGIGAPRFTSSDQAVLSSLFSTQRKAMTDLRLMLIIYMLTGTITGFVIDLVIYRNRIVRCVLDAPAAGDDIFAIARATGGIALALNDGMYIEENIVQDCGRDARRALCGIFAAFAVDVTVRDNYVLNNGGDTRARQITADFAADRFTATPAAGSGDTVMVRSAAPQESVHKASYDEFRRGQAAGNLAAFTPALTVDAGPRGGIVLPICLSANLFMGGSSKLAGSVPQDITTIAKGRHAARVDGNYVVQPFGRALFLGAAGTVSVTDNQLFSDRALTFEQDQRSGGLVGLVTGRLNIGGEVNLSSSNTFVVNLAPSASVTELLLLALAAQTGNFQNLLREGLPSGKYAAGFPDGGILFTGNQIRQSDAGERQTMVTLFSLDDVNFADNQIEVLNGDHILATALVMGSTVRASHNRMKEPILPALRGVMTDSSARRGPRFSLATLNFLLGNMNDNQGNYCFIAVGDKLHVTGNLSALETYLKCGEPQQQMPNEARLMFIVLLALASQFMKSIYQDG
ncbi:hypothetical protein FBR02_05805 [Anaerolineae bacterium CFX9]|nr:hypothetical protein [Anaerolineae bacterium CFX9]